MIEWLILQTLVLSILVLLMVSLYRLSLNSIGAKAYYYLWLVVPVQLLLSTTKSDSLLAQDIQISTYVVSASSAVQGLQASVAFNLPYIEIIWAVGFAVFSALLIAQHYSTIKKLRIKPVNHNLSDALSCRRIKVYESSLIASPMVTGLLSPKIVIPLEFSSHPKQIKELLIKHEVIHWQRGDLWWNALAVTLLLMFWFNPLMWIGYRLFRQTQELACDSDVLFGQDKDTRLSYAKAFLEQSFVQQRMTFTSLYYGGKQNMKDRISNMRTRNQSKILLPPLLAVLISVLGITQAVSGNYTHEAKKTIDGVNPVMRIEPLYPKEAAEKGIEGSVVLQFSINTDGSVDDIHIVKSAPENVFDKSATTALSQWKYTKPDAKMKNMLVQLDYLLSEKSSKNLLSNMEQISVASRH